MTHVLLTHARLASSLSWPSTQNARCQLVGQTTTVDYWSALLHSTFAALARERQDHTNLSHCVAISNVRLNRPHGNAVSNVNPRREKRRHRYYVMDLINCYLFNLYLNKRVYIIVVYTFICTFICTFYSFQLLHQNVNVKVFSYQCTCPGFIFICFTQGRKEQVTLSLLSSPGGTIPLVKGSYLLCHSVRSHALPFPSWVSCSFSLRPLCIVTQIRITTRSYETSFCKDYVKMSFCIHNLHTPAKKNQQKPQDFVFLFLPTCISNPEKKNC